MTTLSGYELSLGGLQYVLSSGIWYQVVDDFIERINKTVKDIPPPNVTLPTWNQIEHEGQYNLRAAKKTSCLAFDTKNIMYGGGQSKFEFCDFMHEKKRTLFFAKIGSKSNGMSHLIEQVRRTSELLFSLDGAYRLRLQKIFTKQHPNAATEWLDSRPKPGEWQLCFVSLGRPALKLPFFARCGLARAVKDLRERGHDVSFVAV